MLLSVLEVNRSPDVITTAAGLDATLLRMHGSRPDELARGVADIATLVGKYETTFGDVKDAISLGIALAIEWQGRFRRADGTLYEEGHYSVVNGVDPNEMTLHIVDPDDTSDMPEGQVSFQSLVPRWWEDNLFQGPRRPPRRGYGLALALATEGNAGELKRLGFERVTYEWCLGRTIEVVA
jgi:hypothetical protein